MSYDTTSKPPSLTPASPAREEADLVILRGMLAASNDACWCMEFTEPIDLTAADHEVVRRVFENGPVWRHCNAAMERLYQLPLGQDMNDRPVHEVFPDNPNNREFVRNLIANGFEVDGAPALDRRYDGLEIYVENDVRAHISNGKLYRMFGTVRNVTKHRRREQALADKLATLNGMVAAIPNPFLAIDPFGVIEAVNSAAEAWLECKAEALIGQSLDAMLQGVHLGGLLPDLENAVTKVQSLAIAMTLRFAGQMPDSVWQIAPRETPAGTGYIVMIIPDNVVGG